jgi:hypothetical protein
MKKSALALLIVGVIVALAGLTFTLQGMGLVGPVGGLMYNNPVWVTQGELTFVVGAVLVVAAFALNRQVAAPAKS